MGQFPGCLFLLRANADQIWNFCVHRPRKIDNIIGRIELSHDWRYDKDNGEATKLFESAGLEKCLEKSRASRGEERAE